MGLRFQQNLIYPAGYFDAERVGYAVNPGGLYGIASGRDNVQAFQHGMLNPLRRKPEHTYQTAGMDPSAYQERLRNYWQKEDDPRLKQLEAQVQKFIRTGIIADIGKVHWPLPDRNQRTRNNKPNRFNNVNASLGDTVRRIYEHLQRNFQKEHSIFLAKKDPGRYMQSTYASMFLEGYQARLLRAVNAKLSSEKFNVAKKTGELGDAEHTTRQWFSDGAPPKYIEPNGKYRRKTRNGKERSNLTVLSILPSDIIRAYVILDDTSTPYSNYVVQLFETQYETQGGRLQLPDDKYTYISMILSHTLKATADRPAFEFDKELLRMLNAGREVYMREYVNEVIRRKTSRKTVTPGACRIAKKYEDALLSMGEDKAVKDHRAGSETRLQGLCRNVAPNQGRPEAGQPRVDTSLEERVNRVVGTEPRRSNVNLSMNANEVKRWIKGKLNSVAFQGILRNMTDADLALAAKTLQGHTTNAKGFQVLSKLSGVPASMMALESHLFPPIRYLRRDP